MASSIPRIVLVGHPNVGKSQLFNLLTGSQVAVSNYPGTTVEVAGGRGQIEGRPVEVWDTPGLYSLSAVSAEEQVTRLGSCPKPPGHPGGGSAQPSAYRPDFELISRVPWWWPLT